MQAAQPTFPPLLTGHRVRAGAVPTGVAASQAAAGDVGAGDLFWLDHADRLQFALVLEPDVPNARCQEIVQVAMVAAGDAIGALCPPEISVTYRWPSIILVNEAEAGFVDLLTGPADAHATPDWMVVSLHLRLRPEAEAPEPGLAADRTTLWDEGCGELSQTKLLESISRHMVNLIHHWSEDGFKPIHDQWWGRISAGNKIAAGIIERDEDKLLGLDENGNALLKTSAGTGSVPTMDALKTLREARGEQP